VTTRNDCRYGSKLSVRYGVAISSSPARSLMHGLPKNGAFAAIEVREVAT